jgi:hypothetical protein
VPQEHPRNDFKTFYTSSDYGNNIDGTYSHIQWIKGYKAIETVLDAIELCEETGNPLLFQIDYTHSKLGDQAQLGIIAIADLRMQCHPVIYDYNKTENKTGASGMIQTLLYLLQLCGYDESRHGKVYIIMDGSPSLRSACIEKGCIPVRCDVHAFRMPDFNKGKKGHSGTAGSFMKFLQKHNLESQQAYILRMVVYTFKFLPDKKTYIVGRRLFLHQFEHEDLFGISLQHRNALKEHLFSYYIPETPEIGYAATLPGQVKNTNW